MKPRSAKKKTKKKKKSHIPFRLNLLFLVVFFAFVALIVRLAYVQIVKGQDFEALVRRTETTMTTTAVPRGLIYDSQGRILVGNQAKLSITYTRPSKIDPSEMLKIAQQLSQYIHVDTSKLKEQDLKDYWYLTHPDEAKKLLSEAERKQAVAESLTPGELYMLELEKIPSEALQFSEADKQTVAIFTKMNSASALNTVTIKNNDVSEEEAAKVNERMYELKGINVATNWDRTYPMEDMLRSILGTVSSEETGLPSDQVNTLLTNGYALNDRVGISYLEEQYETVLRGTKAMTENTINTDGETISSKEVYPGKNGSSLLLTIDTEFQRKLEHIATDVVQSQPDPTSDRVYIVVMNPSSGDILGITGKKRAYDENGYVTGVEDDALGAINSSYAMGSSIKAATVLAGYMDGVISIDDNHILDEPMTFAGSETKSSLFNRYGKVVVDDEMALQVSSNIYMIKIAMRMGGQYDYVEGGRLNIRADIFDKLRNYYAQFGLGVKTGIDIPNESTGYQGSSAESFAALDFSFGQYDLYTPLQLAQYIATIANDGTRMAPRLVKEIHASSSNGQQGLGELEAAVEPTTMNSLQTTQDVLDRVKNGLYRVTHNGTSAKYFGNYTPAVSGKTGTAEAFYGGPLQQYQQMAVTNSTFASYAPAHDPEIAVAVVVPYMAYPDQGGSATEISKRVYQAYFSN